MTVGTAATAAIGSGDVTEVVNEVVYVRWFEGCCEATCDCSISAGRLRMLALLRMRLAMRLRLKVEPGCMVAVEADTTPMSAKRSYC